MGNRKYTLYGFEDYNVEIVSSSLLTNKISNIYDFMSWASEGIRVPVKNEMLNASGHLDSNLVRDNKEILSTAKSLYVHPSCKLSRSLVNQKYKKALNPWFADGVVIPDPTENGYDNSMEGAVIRDSAIFVNEDKKLVVLIEGIYWDKVADKLNNVPIGTRLSSLLNIHMTIDSEGIQNIIDSELEYKGPLVRLTNSNKYIIDIITDSLPKDKIVFEQSVMATLGNEENTPTEESLMSIYEMLISSDEDTVGSAIKALSMMDYIHYPNSVRLVFQKADRQSRDWRYNPATDTTAAKYMFNCILNGTARGRIKFKSGHITQGDWDLFLSLMKRFYKQEELLSWLGDYPFIYADDNMSLHPRIIP